MQNNSQLRHIVETGGFKIECSLYLRVLEEGITSLFYELPKKLTRNKPATPKYIARPAAGWVSK